jgi:hypothetical protein
MNLAASARGERAIEHPAMTRQQKFGEPLDLRHSLGQSPGMTEERCGADGAITARSSLASRRRGVAKASGGSRSSAGT